MKTLFVSTAVPGWVERLGWSLVHSLWQLAAIALVAALLHRCLRHRSARVRYFVAVAMLALMFAMPIATWCLVSIDPVSLASSSVHDETGVTSNDGEGVVPRLVTTEADSLTAANSSNAQSAEPWGETPKLAAREFVVGNPSKEATGNRTAARDNPASVSSNWRRVGERISQILKPRLPIFVGIWFLGVLICSIRPIWSLWIQWQLRRAGLWPVPESVQSALNSLAQKMRLTRVVRVAQSTLVKVPMVVGYLRPMILLPASVLTGLTPLQLEAVLAHELAHVRRHDWLINAIQVLAETLLFYHPAVWWLSRRIRHERELCCDDIALGLDVDKAVYARTLLTLEELRQECITPALAATGGDLSSRVRRLLPASNADPQFGPGTIVGLISIVVSLTMLATSLVASNQPQDARTVAVATVADEPKPASAPEAETSTAQSEPAKPAASDRRRSVQVLDENEQPVSGAEVGLQFQHQGADSFSIDGILSEKTNEKGVVEVEAPKESENVYVTIKADGFGEFNEQQQATGDSIVRLKRGRVIHVRAIDEAGVVLKRAVPLLADHRVWGREFLPQEDGTFKSPAVDMNRRLMRVVTAQEDGPMLFSDLVDVAEAKPGADGMLELVLKPGTKLTGRLDDSVPRPISEGYVQLMVVEGPNHKLRVPVRDENGEFRDAERINPWTWEDSTSVEPDGTFTFESVPAGGLAQIHVVVDGYMSANPPLEELVASLEAHGTADDQTPKALQDQVRSRAMWPHLVALDKPSVEATIKCQPTASCDFRILDPSGNPVENADVSFSPNGIFISGKLFIPGSNGFQTASLVEELFWDVPTFAALNGQEDKTTHGASRRRENEWGARSFLRAKSDINGIVKIRNLPGGTRESFTVTAKGFVLPKSQLYPSDSFGDDRREAYVDLIAGETIESTIYLDRDQPVIDREVLVMDDKGRPLPGITISLSEMRVGPKDWQLWSTQRFGAVQSAKSDQNGRVVLSVPSQIGDVPVERLRLAVNYEYEGDNGPFFNPRDREERFWINGGLVDAPLKADDGFVAVIRNPDSSRNSKAVYGTLENILPKQTSAQLLAVMIKNPSLAILRQLLASAKTKQPEPIELLDEGRRGEEPKGTRVHLIPSGDSLFALVSARVRPVDGTRANETDMSNLPECVFVFDAGGQHVVTLGGEIGTTGVGSAENTSILCLGPEEDWFVRVTRFQKNGSFEYQSTYYRVGNPVVNSLRYFHYPNSNAWSNGPEKIARYGSLYFDFPGSRGNRADDTVGMTNDGVSVNGIITWDADQNKFVGVAEQSVEGRPLYKVDTEWSTDFEALTPKADQMILSGGAREHDHWYGWSTFVPEGCEAVVSVFIPQADSDAKIIEQKYASGLHTIQFQAKPNDDGQGGSLQLGYDKDQIHKGTIPLPLGDPPAVHPPIVNVLDPGESTQLVSRSLKGSTDSLTLQVKLQSVEK